MSGGAASIPSTTAPVVTDDTVISAYDGHPLHHLLT